MHIKIAGFVTQRFKSEKKFVHNIDQGINSYRNRTCTVPESIFLGISTKINKYFSSKQCSSPTQPILCILYILLQKHINLPAIIFLTQSPGVERLNQKVFFFLSCTLVYMYNYVQSSKHFTTVCLNCSSAIEKLLYWNQANTQCFFISLKF